MKKYIMIVCYTHYTSSAALVKTPSCSHLETEDPELFHTMGRRLLEENIIKSYQLAELVGSPLGLSDVP